MTRETIAIFLTDHPHPHTAQHGDFADQSTTVLRRAGYEGEIKVFNTIEQEYPTVEELQSIRAVWITGSVHDAFADVPWINKLVAFIQQHKELPIVGICFGHQAIGRAYGARVGRNPKGWEFGTHDVQLSQDKAVQELFYSFGSAQFKILQVHQDVVFDCPDELCVLGSTAATQIQGFYKKNQVLSFQGHPEFTVPFQQNLLQSLYGDGLFTEEQRQVFEKQLVEHQGVELAQVTLKFIEGA